MIRMTCQKCSDTIFAPPHKSGGLIRCTSCRAFTDVPKVEEQPGMALISSAYYQPPTGNDQSADPARTKSSDADAATVTLTAVETTPPPAQALGQRWRKATPEPTSAPAVGNNSLEGFILNGGVLGGAAAMIIAMAWFIFGLMNDTFWIYPPIMFVMGLAGLMKGLMGNNKS